MSAAFFAMSFPVAVVAGERDDPDVGVADERVPDRDAVAGHDVEHAGREDLGLGDSSAKRSSVSGVQLGRLDHDELPAASAGPIFQAAMTAGSSTARSVRRRRSARAGGCW